MFYQRTTAEAIHYLTKMQSKKIVGDRSASPKKQNCPAFQRGTSNRRGGVCPTMQPLAVSSAAVGAGSASPKISIAVNKNSIRKPNAVFVYKPYIISIMKQRNLQKRNEDWFEGNTDDNS